MPPQLDGTCRGLQFTAPRKGLSQVSLLADMFAASGRQATLATRNRYEKCTWQLDIGMFHVPTSLTEFAPLIQGPWLAPHAAPVHLCQPQLLPSMICSRAIPVSQSQHLPGSPVPRPAPAQVPSSRLLWHWPSQLSSAIQGNILQNFDDL